jgi:hydroxypyruvate isomerase
MSAQALKFAANLSWLYTDLPFLDRFAAAAQDGFTGVECLFPHEHPTPAVLSRLRDAGLQLVLFNAAPGQWAQGERGLACLPGRETDFQRSVLDALALSQTLGCPRIHVMAGLVPPDPNPSAFAAAFATAWSVYEANLRWAAAQAEQHSRILTIEPINPRDMPHYLLTHQAQAHALVQRIGSAHLQVQMDLYHCQIVEGDITARLRQWVPTGRVGHVQIAAVPDRGEPDDGELNYPHLFNTLRDLGWDGWIGCEYKPRRSPVPTTPGQATRDGLGWLNSARAASQA